jgi:Ni/Fe-hydrogenase 1 B-type cytochrome subunit
VNHRIRVYAWEFPVRFSHWMNVLAILTLAATGIYIGNPYVHAHSSTQYVMGWMRFLHFTAGYVFLMSFIIRIYWAFIGNRYASWRVWFPFTPKRFRDFMDALKFYTFRSRKPPYSVGHTAVAGVTYFFIFLLYAFMISSGFAMYSLSSQSTIAAVLGGWLLSLMELQTIRLFHHLSMYIIVAFVATHIYIAWWLDTVEKNGLIDGIFSGYKFVTGKEWE